MGWYFQVLSINPNIWSPIKSKFWFFIKFCKKRLSVEVRSPQSGFKSSWVIIWNGRWGATIFFLTSFDGTCRIQLLIVRFYPPLRLSDFVAFLLFGVLQNGQIIKRLRRALVVFHILGFLCLIWELYLSFSHSGFW